MSNFHRASEYLIHDPIALRHCILYEFVQGKPVDTAYTEFCEKFPEYYFKSGTYYKREIIEKEDFEYWFDQFKKGKFDDNKEPVTDMTEYLRSDKRALRACILSESLERQICEEVSHGGFILPYIEDDYRKSFKKYMHFREVLGKDVMNYKEFRFWMDRFERNIDLGYEGPMDFKETGFSKRPDFSKCDEYLEMIDRLSEMFKDPILFRYCILFEFLKHRPIEEGYQNFCRKVGANVIDLDTFQYWFNEFEQGIFDDNKVEEKVVDLDTFQYWFNQFEHGIFDDNEEPVADIRDILRSDQRALRVCILYVSLNYKTFDNPSSVQSVKCMKDRRFPIYSLFCDIIGENVMEYEEFVYWQIRFSDGKFDFDHERSLENKKELTDMPIDVMENLVQYLSIIDRAKLRRTAKAFHIFIDCHPLFLKEISFFSCAGDRYPSSIEMSPNLNETYSNIYTDNQRKECHITPGYGVRVVDREDYQKCAMEDLKLIIQTPNLHSEHLVIKTNLRSVNDYIYWDSECPHQNDLLNGLWTVIDPSEKLRIKYINITSTVLEHIVNFLACLEPGYLRSISLNCGYTHGDRCSRMLELEQFKQAKDFTLKSLSFSGSIRDLLHLDSFDISMDTLSAEDFRILREVAFKSSTFNSCSLSVKEHFDFYGIRRELYDLTVPGFRQNEFRYLIPNTKDCFEITIGRSRISVFKSKNYRETYRRQMEIHADFQL